MNRYVKAAMEANENKLPKTFDEYSRMHPSDASRIPVSHVHKLIAERDNALASKESAFASKKINWD